MSEGAIHYLGVIGIMACAAAFIFLNPVSSRKEQGQRNAEREVLLDEREALMKEYANLSNES
ncbi:hypothetical protein [Mesorhizobium sp. SP-1A]|uniref:hypothetical protein n=1 Tax=Mesorhizobium sp. SP-1A TaxID=3077840 RepID=UPI0028F71304|nr:hypothetical protein [Mesorhizobium sp. SP-1A]